MKCILEDFSQSEIAEILAQHVRNVNKLDGKHKVSARVSFDSTTIDVVGVGETTTITARVIIPLGDG